MHEHEYSLCALITLICSLSTFLQVYVMCLIDDEGGTVKPRGSLNQRSCNSDTLYTRLGLLLSRDSNSRSFTEDVSLASINSKPVSSNGSPVSTLTGSSETEHKAIKEQSSDSIGSLMSMSGQSNGSSSPLTRRHSVTSK